MEEITGINHVGIPVTDLTKARAFYEQLGFVFIVGPIGPEPVAIMEHPGGIVINFILNASSTNENNILMDVPEKYTGYTHIALEVNDIESTKTSLVTIGITITEGPITFPGDSGTSLFIRDQDQNVIEFHQPAK